MTGISSLAFAHQHHALPRLRDQSGSIGCPVPIEAAKTHCYFVLTPLLTQSLHNMSQDTTQDLTQFKSDAQDDLQEDPEDDTECIATLEYEGKDDTRGEKLGKRCLRPLLFHILICCSRYFPLSWR